MLKQFKQHSKLGLAAAAVLGAPVAAFAQETLPTFADTGITSTVLRTNILTPALGIFAVVLMVSLIMKWTRRGTSKA